MLASTRKQLDTCYGTRDMYIHMDVQCNHSHAHRKVENGNVHVHARFHFTLQECYNTSMVEGDCRMGSNLTTVATETSIAFSLMYSAGMVAACVCVCVCVCWKKVSILQIHCDQGT